MFGTGPFEGKLSTSDRIKRREVPLKNRTDMQGKMMDSPIQNAMALFVHLQTGDMNDGNNHILKGRNPMTNSPGLPQRHASSYREHGGIFPYPFKNRCNVQPLENRIFSPFSTGQRGYRKNNSRCARLSY